MAAIRSLLFVPGDSERKITRALASSADSLILDLEDSVAPERRAVARDLCREILLANPGAKIFVRVNPFESPDCLLDLVAVVRAAPYGVMLPKCPDAYQVLRLSDLLTGLEARDGVPPGQTRILPIATETAAALFGFASYVAEPVLRLYGLLWGGEDLAADIGAAANRDELGAYTPPFQLARSLCLMGAAAAGVAPIDAVFTDFRDHAGLRQEAMQAARNGFVAKAAIHPDQVEIINQEFTPSATAAAWAAKVVAAFAASPGAAVVALEGKMLDRPHHKAALRILASQ
jgi:citrate lyase subunit beta/citryl-CoA lyase